MEGKLDNRRRSADHILEENCLEIPLNKLSVNVQAMRASILYPEKEAVPFNLQDNVLRIWLKQPVMARLFMLEW